MATASELLAVFAFGMAMASSRASTVTGTLGLTLTEWALVTILAGACTGLLFTVFIGREDDRMRMNVATIGVIVFAAGVGTALGVSPLLVNLIAGLTVALIYPNAERLETALGPLRFPTSVLVLLFAGLTWVPVSGLLWAFIPGYAALRVVARLFFSRLAAATFFPDKAAAVGIGRGLLAQGVVAGAISLAFAQRFPQSADIVTTTILGGLVLTDVLAMRSLRRYLADVGEIRALGETDKERI
jgi:Kef-type K+ transport system membrane component KefB